jgi:hypothetical protein
MSASIVRVRARPHGGAVTLEAHNVILTEQRADGTTGLKPADRRGADDLTHIGPAITGALEPAAVRPALGRDAEQPVATGHLP